MYKSKLKREVPASIIFGSGDFPTDTPSTISTKTGPSSPQNTQTSSRPLTQSSPLGSRPILYSGGFNQRTMAKLNYKNCSQQELQEQLKKKYELLNNRSIVCHLSDGGKKIRDTIEQIQQALKQSEITDSIGSLSISDGDKLSKSPDTQLPSSTGSTVSGNTDNLLDEIETKMSRMEVGNDDHDEKLPDVTCKDKTSKRESAPNKDKSTIGTDIGDPPSPLVLGRYAKPVRLKAISVSQAVELEKQQIRMKEELFFKQSSERLQTASSSTTVEVSNISSRYNKTGELSFTGNDDTLVGVGVDREDDDDDGDDDDDDDDDSEEDEDEYQSYDDIDEQDEV